MNALVPPVAPGLHIADVAEFYAPLGGGVKTYIDAKLSYASRHGHRVSVIAPGRETRIEHRPGGEIIYVAAPAIPIDQRYHLFCNASPVHRLLDFLKPDIVEASSPWRAAGIVADWQGPAAAHARKVLVMHADAVAAHPQVWFRKYLSPAAIDRACFWFWAYLRRTSRAYSDVIVGSRWFGARLLQKGSIPSTVIPLGVDKALFNPARRDTACRRRLLANFGLPASATLLVGVGRHHPEKQWPVVFEAVGALKGRGVAMIQIGSGFRNACVRRAARAAGNVDLLGRIDDRALLARIVASSDALIHGSSAETFGIAASEGLAAGLPLILPTTGGCSDVADPAWAEVYRSGRSADACNAIERFLHRNAAELRAAAIHGQATRVASSEEHFQRLFAFYESGKTPGKGVRPLNPPLPVAA